MIIASVAAIVGMFLFYPFRPGVVGKTLVGWTWLACNNYSGYLHGRLVPLIFPWLLFVAYRRSRQLTLSPSYWGLICLSLGLFLFWAGLRATQPRICLLGIPLVIIGLTQYLAGAKIAGRTIFPAFFLYFAIPTPYIERFLSGQFQIFLTKTTYQIGLFLGSEISLQGLTIALANGTEIYFGRGFFGIGGTIGIRLFMLTLMTAALLSYLIPNSSWKRWPLFLSVFPLLIFYTLASLVFILFLVENGHDRFAMGFYSVWFSVVVFALTTGTLLLISYLLKRLKPSPPKYLSL